MRIADLIVLAPDRPDVMLVVEIKSSGEHLNSAEQQLKAYMLDRRCSTALVVTPEVIRIYRDTFKDFSESSIVLAGEFVTKDFLPLPGGLVSSAELEGAVRGWLERLAASWPSAVPSAAPARRSVVEHLVPAVSEGRVMAGSLG